MTQPLKLAVVCFPGLGGSGVVASELVNGLAARGHHVHVVSTALPERLHASAGDIQFERIDVPVSPVFEHGPYDVAVASHLVELVRTNHIDLIHLHYAVPHAASALLARTVLGAAAPAIVTTLHGTDVTRTPPNLWPVTAFALAACDGLTTPSQYLRAAAAQQYGVAAERIEVIPNFVDLERFSPARRAGDAAPGPTLFHVSNFRPIKRTLDLVEVLARVRQHVPARAVLVGDGPERAAVEARAAELGLTDAIEMLGRRDDFAALLAHADGFILPSESEGFGVAALEAMASGVPVFGYEVGGLPEVVVPGTGILVPCCDVDALAAAVVTGLAQRAALGRAARARAEDSFGGDAAVDRYVSYFRRVIATKAGA